MLISVNPFKQMPYFGEKEVEMYQGAVSTYYMINERILNRSVFVEDSNRKTHSYYKSTDVPGDLWWQQSEGLVAVRTFQRAGTYVAVRNLTQPLRRFGSTFTEQPIQVCLLSWPACWEWACLLKPGTHWKTFKILTDCENTQHHIWQTQQFVDKCTGFRFV